MGMGRMRARELLPSVTAWSSSLNVPNCAKSPAIHLAQLCLSLLPEKPGTAKEQRRHRVPVCLGPDSVEVTMGGEVRLGSYGSLWLVLCYPVTSQLTS